MFFQVGFYVLLVTLALSILLPRAAVKFWRETYEKCKDTFNKYHELTEDTIRVQKEHIALLQQRLVKSQENTDNALKLVDEQSILIGNLLDAAVKDPALQN